MKALYRNTNKGFTLLEVLFSIFIFSLFAAASLNFFISVGDVKEKIIKDGDFINKFSFSNQIMEEDFYNLDKTSDENNLDIYKNSISFYTTAVRESLEREFDYNKVFYYLKEGKIFRKNIKYIIEDEDIREIPNKYNEIILFDNIKDFNISSSSKYPEKDGKRDNLNPKIIKMEFEFNNGLKFERLFIY